MTIPVQLQDVPQWVIWRCEEREPGEKLTKVPYSPTVPTTRASSTDPSTWSDYATAVAAAKKADVSGIGFVVTEKDEFCGIDIDNCIVDGEIHPDAQAIVDEFASYTERSPSGNGLRIFITGKKPGTRSKEKVVPWGGELEVYDHSRFFTVTGDQLAESSDRVEARQLTLEGLYWRTWPKPDPPRERTQASTPAIEDDAELIRRAINARNGAEFSALWNGDTSGHGDDDSAADLALCNHLAFWTNGDAVRVDRLFRASGLMRDKWDSNRGDTTYGEITIEKAISDVSSGGGHRTSTATMTTTTRYEGRHVDLGTLLAQPPKPIPWRVEDLVADGTLTVLAGRAGSGKSWVAQAACLGVARGTAVGGLRCKRGTALYVDGEMGGEMFVDQRLRPAWITTPEFEYIDAGGLDFSKDQDMAWIRSKIVEIGADFVVFDSLRRLAISKSENDSDDMAPTMAGFQRLSRETGAAILLLHHSGSGPEFSRGSTAIDDQCDALFGLLREGREDGDDDGVRTLRCKGRGKMRYAPEPPDVYLMISPEHGGVIETDARPRPRSGGSDSKRAQVKDAIVAALPAKSKTEVAAVVGRRIDDSTFKLAWADLERANAIAKDDGRWVVVMATPRDQMTTTTQESLITTGTCASCGDLMTDVAGTVRCFGCGAVAS